LTAEKTGGQGQVHDEDRVHFYYIFIQGYYFVLAKLKVLSIKRDSKKAFKINLQYS
jgi:hypothetical protein